jgi:uncharacterized protein YbaR (Trm112 family)
LRYIHPCPNCRVDLRFPLDKGVLNITCPNCNYSFRIDPDDPSLFKQGAFDLTKPAQFNPFQFNKSLSTTQFIQRLIPFFLFLLLALHLSRNCSQTDLPNQKEFSPPIEEKDKSLPIQEENTQEI